MDRLRGPHIQEIYAVWFVKANAKLVTLESYIGSDWWNSSQIAKDNKIIWESNIDKH